MGISTLRGTIGGNIKKSYIILKFEGNDNNKI